MIGTLNQYRRSRDRQRYRPGGRNAIAGLLLGGITGELLIPATTPVNDVGDYQHDRHFNQDTHHGRQRRAGIEAK